MQRKSLLYRGLAILLVGWGILTLGACAGMMPTSAPRTEIIEQPPEPSKGLLMTKGPKKRIAVLRFAVGTDTYGWTGVDEAAAEMLTTALFKTGQFIVVERNLLDKVLQEQGLSLSGAMDPSTAVEVGKALGVQALITGAVTQIGLEKKGGSLTGYLGFERTNAETTVDIRCIDTTTAQLIMVDTGAGQASTSSGSVLGMGGGIEAERNKLLGEALRAAVEDVAQRLVAQMQTVPWSGRIARVAENSIYINAGTSLGIKAGDQLAVYRPGTEIKDPATGQILGVEEILIGQLLVTDVRDQYSVTAVNSGTGFHQNDIVRLVKQ